MEYSFGPDPKLADTGRGTRIVHRHSTKPKPRSPPAMRGAEDFAAAMQAMAGLRRAD